MIVCLDANCVIYLVESQPHWGPLLVARLAELRLAGHEFATSDLSRTECLAGPMGHPDAPLVLDYQRFFSSPAIRMLPLTPQVCEAAARLRAQYKFKLKTPDCLHLASAIVHGCELFITNDSPLKQCHEIKVEILQQ